MYAKCRVKMSTGMSKHGAELHMSREIPGVNIQMIRCPNDDVRICMNKESNGYDDVTSVIVTVRYDDLVKLVNNLYREE